MNIALRKTEKYNFLVLFCALLPTWYQVPGKHDFLFFCALLPTGEPARLHTSTYAIYSYIYSSVVPGGQVPGIWEYADDR